MTGRGFNRWVRPVLLVALLLALAPVNQQAKAQESSQPEYAVQLIYAIPNGGEDRGLDQDGTILGSVESAQRWLDGQTGGRRLNLVTDRHGKPAIEFLELSRTEDELNTWPESSASYQIEYEARANGFNQPGVIYAVYYEGADIDLSTCGETPWPVYTPGNSFTLFLQGDCSTFEILDADDEAGWWELTFMHEFFHAIGAVEPCSPNDVEGHAEETNDLMYGASEPWAYPVLLDVDNDDYFGHGRNACYDAARSPYLVPHGEIVEPYPSPFIDLPMDGCTFESGEIVEENELAEVWIVNLGLEPIEIVWFDADQEPDSLGSINGWDAGIFTALPGDVLHVMDSGGDCLGSYEMPDFVEIGAAWVTSD